MEEVRNNYMKILRLFGIILCMLIVQAQAQAQVTDGLPAMDFKEKKSYEIGAVTVKGAEFTDANALIGVSGLKVGDVITVPGREVANAMKAIYNLKRFTDVQVIAKEVVGEVIFLEIEVEERPRFFTHSFKGVKKSYHDDLTHIVEDHLKKGSILTDAVKGNLISAFKVFFKDKGYLDATVNPLETEFPGRKNAVKVIFDIDLNDKIKIGSIAFVGNAQTGDAKLNKKLTDRKLRKQMKSTKQKKRFLAKSRFVDGMYAEDKKAVIAYYNKLGLRDARIVRDSIWRREDGHTNIKLFVNEGNQYYFRKITWEGNVIYDDATLASVLAIEKGDVYNPELLSKRLEFSQDSRDVSSLYMDNGYLFFRVDPIEVAVTSDSIDLEMRIYEGPQATIDKVTITGNDRTHEHVIRRVLRTNPGEKFSRSNIIRSQREILSLGYFDQEQLQIGTPVNANRGTVDIEYGVVERPSDQLELSAGYNGNAGVLGTVGVVFNNFSARRMFKKGAWKPVPTGDGQKLSLRAQSNGRVYKSVNFSFTEPWLGGKKPNSFTLGGYYSTFALGGSINNNVPSFSKLNSTAGYVGLGTRWKWPDDYFYSNTTLYYQNNKLVKNAYQLGTSRVFNFEGLPVFRGSFNNIYLSQTIARSSINEPLFPTRGSKFELILQVTPPYSIFKKDDFYVLSELEKADVLADEITRRRRYGITAELTQTEQTEVLHNAETAKRFKFLEYHKWRFNAEWYTSLVGKLVLRSSAKMGYLGHYDKSVGISPFERFQLGGDGLSNQNSGIQGIDIIRLRGYEVTDLQDRNGDGRVTQVEADENAVIFNKFELELRYPLSTNPNSTIYALGFLEGGNSYHKFSDYEPFNLKRSAGLGLRVFLPIFGLLGFDYGWGFDKDAVQGGYGKFGLVIGFEPD